MINLLKTVLTKRELIIYFFSKFTKNKLNKNVYNINFYKNRDAEYVYELITNFYNNHPILRHASIAQKYYHIYHNIDDIPDNKPFINFAKGYVGVTHSTPKNIARVPDDKMYSIDETIEMIRTKLYNSDNSISSAMKNQHKFADQILIASIYKHTQQYNLPLKHRIKILLNHETPENLFCPFCTSHKKIHQFKLCNTCGGSECKKKFLTKSAIERKSYKSFQTPDARQKRLISLRGRKLTEEHRYKLSQAKKLQWTDEYKARDKAYRKESGINEKISRTMRSRVMRGHTPTNNRTRAKQKYRLNDITYRSSWEYIFHKNNPHLLYEHTRVEYTINGKEHVYIVDFTDIAERVLYEIKPHCYTTEEIFKIKSDAAIRWCTENEFKYKVITEKDYEFKI